ncbi:MAG TPA: Rne/Rng family ribonuclease [Rhodothermales bacterium]|nr:Rne/Rng family ribonuclease [Rhodothermales bacterium]
MSKEIVINSQKEQTQIALLEDGELVELYIETSDNARTLGNIYLGRIRKIMPNIQACFVDIGQKQDAFLHFSDISDTTPEMLRYLGETVEMPSSAIEVKEESLAKSISDRYDLGDEDEPPSEDEELEYEPVLRNDRPDEAQRKNRRKKRPTSENNQRERANGNTHEASGPAKSETSGVVKETHKAAATNTETDSQPNRNRSRSQKNPHTRPQKERSEAPSTEDAPLQAATDAVNDPASPIEKPAREHRNRRSGPPQHHRSEHQNPAAHKQSDPLLTSEKSDEGPTTNDEENLGDDTKNPETSKPRSRRRGGQRRRPSSSDTLDMPSVPGESTDSGSDSNPIALAAIAESVPSQTLKPAISVHPAKYLREGHRILVKISKEPISNKGSRVTTDVSLAGRFLVLVPMANYVAVSKKIASQKERKRLRVLASSLLPQGFGLIVRTVAQDRDAKSLYTDLKLLIDKWKRIEENIQKKGNPPAVIYQDVSMASSVIRDLFTEDFDRILIDDARAHKNIKSYVQAIAPQMTSAVQLYTDTPPIFKATKIEKQIEEAYSSRVDMPSGGYLFIEHTEAMHVVDVNSGRAGHGLTQEENSLNVNLEAVRYIAKHLRLRDLGGIIVIDFIDLRLDSHRRKVLQALRREFRKDRAVTKVLPMSDFGLVEITRQRLRPSYTTSIARQPAPNRVLINPSVETVLKRIEAWLEIYKAQTGKTSVTLQVHPFLMSYLKHLRDGLVPRTIRWRFGMKVRVHLVADEVIDPVHFRFVDSDSGEDLTEKFRFL